MFDPIFYPGLCEFTRATSAVQRLYCSVLLRFQDSIIVIFSNVFGEDFFCWVLLFAAEVCFLVSQFQGHLTVLGVLSCYTEITCKNNKEQEMNFRSFGFSGTEELCSAC